MAPRVCCDSDQRFVETWGLWFIEQCWDIHKDITKARVITSRASL